MSRNTLCILLAVAIIEGILIATLISRPRGVILKVYSEAVQNPSPLYWALEYEAPDRKFEELVKKNPSWVRYRDPVTGSSALTACVALKRTNCVRILIANGANFEEAIKAEKKAHNEGSVLRLQQFQAELK
jgi:hypothetical protein